MVELATTFSWDGTPSPHKALCTLRIGADALLITLLAPFHGNPPPRGPPGPTWKLWEHEAVELFICSAENPPLYTELEFGPWGHHLALRLDGVRNIVERELPLAFSPHRSGVAWAAEVTVPLALLPPRSPKGWRVNLTSVSGPPKDRRYHTAARLGSDHPDFHRPDEFIPGVLPL